MLLLKLLYLILSLIMFCFIMKNSTPCTPSGQGYGGLGVTPSKSILDCTCAKKVITPLIFPLVFFLLQNEVDPSKFAFHPRSPSSVASSDRVRSRLVRSALRDHRVVVETVRTYEMISEFKMNIVIWLQQHGLGHKSELLTAIPDITLNKVSKINTNSK